MWKIIVWFLLSGISSLFALATANTVWQNFSAGRQGLQTLAFWMLMGWPILLATLFCTWCLIESVKEEAARVEKKEALAQQSQ